MKKVAPIAFRIPDDLKKQLQEVAAQEARSVSQICEMMLRLGVDGYEKEGSKYFQRVLTRQKRDHQAQ
jgi:predicted transcriptional regulator